MSMILIFLLSLAGGFSIGYLDCLVDTKCEEIDKNCNMIDEKCNEIMNKIKEW